MKWLLSTYGIFQDDLVSIRTSVMNIQNILKHLLGGELLLCLQLTEQSIEILVRACILDLASMIFWNFVKSMNPFHISVENEKYVCNHAQSRVVPRRGAQFYVESLAKVLIWQKNDNFCVKIGSSNLTSFHRKEISEICSHTFLTKISWKQRFY